MEKFSLVSFLAATILANAYLGSTAPGDEDIRIILREMRANDALQEDLIRHVMEENKHLKKEIKQLWAKNRQFENLINIMLSEVEQRYNEIGILKNKTAKCQEVITNMEVKITELKEEFDAREKPTNNMTVRDPPEVYYCGYSGSSYTTSHGTISYSSLSYSRTNQPTGGLDISSGIFTSPYPGTYQVTWSLLAFNPPDEHLEVYLYKNGKQVPESWTYSKYTGSSGYVFDQGGRTLFIHLNLGEQLHLEYTDGSGLLYAMVFCVNLAQFDQIYFYNRE